MTSLEEPLDTARAIGRVIRTRANAISDLGNQIVELPDPNKVTPEEWIVLSDALIKLLKELHEEIEIFAQKASYAT
ncbi:MULTISPECIES: hypothetical protein [unclassified Roseovarius]|uniref:hypothetical protein n=1 Tax=unclassified Roseovarius TaxID=2614913 RepID=UPI0027400442|nr:MULTISPECIES: hypothetical protein [unclassified Roseovarius]